MLGAIALGLLILVMVMGEGIRRVKKTIREDEGEERYKQMYAGRTHLCAARVPLVDWQG